MQLKDCPVSAALKCIGGKWKPMILNELKNGSVRFGQLQRRIPEASHKVLIEQLRQLQAAGIVKRTIHHEAIVRSEYRLSEFGETLKPALSELARWGISLKRRT
jgi:DNA-binding HxlR family transcriptional regulator